MTSITHAEWVKAFETALAARPQGDEGMTKNELCEQFGTCGDTMIQRLRDLAREGLLVAGRSRRPGIDGVMRSVPVYRLKA